MPYRFSTSIQRRRLLQVASGSIIAAPFTAWSQGLSSRPIRIIVSFPAGGPTDVLARVLAQNMASALGQPVIIENRAGAGGAVGMDVVARSPGDGHTLLFSSIAPLAILPQLAPQAPPISSFSPVGAFAYIPQVLASTRHNSFSALKGRQVVFGNNGNGSLPHIMAVMVARSANLSATHIPYRGAAPMLADMLASQFDAGIAPQIIFEPQRINQKLSYLAATAPLPALNNIPTFEQLGIGDAAFNDWYGLIAPAGTPAASVRQLNAALMRAVQSPEVQQRLNSMGALPQLSSPEQFGQLISLYSDRIGKAIRENGITMS